jgi:hypothetical protein
MVRGEAWSERSAPISCGLGGCGISSRLSSRRGAKAVTNGLRSVGYLPGTPGGWGGSIVVNSGFHQPPAVLLVELDFVALLEHPALRRGNGASVESLNAYQRRGTLHIRPLTWVGHGGHLDLDQLRMRKPVVLSVPPGRAAPRSARAAGWRWRTSPPLLDRLAAHSVAASYVGP